MMLPEHKTAINKQNYELSKRVRPEVDPYPAVEIAEAVSRSFSDQSEITIRVFDEFNDRRETGIVESVDQPRGRLFITGEWVYFRDIIGIE